MLGCHFLLLLGVLPCGKILSFDSVGSFSSLGAYRLCVGHIPESPLTHTGPFGSRLCVFRRGHSRHVFDEYIYHRARVGRDRLSGIGLLPGLDCSVVLCVGPVQPADLASCTRSGPLYLPESGKSYTLCA